MNTNQREMFGDQYRLTILEKDSDAPPATEKMFRIVLDELGVRGNFNFHAKSHLPQSPTDARPKMSAMLAGNEILVTMRWGSEAKDSVSGSLFVPKGARPVEVQAHMAKLLGQLNADGWSELKLNGSAPAPATTSELLAQPSAVAPAPLQPIKVTAPASQSAPPLQTPTDEELALELFKKAGANALIKHHQIQHYLIYHYPYEGQHPYVSEVMTRLGELKLVRRTSFAAGQSTWQFTEKFLEANDLTVENYAALPPATSKQPGPQGTAPAPVPAQAAAQVAAAPPATTSVPTQSEEPHPSQVKLEKLCDEMALLAAERPRAAAYFEEAQHALLELDSQIATKRAEIATALKERCEVLGQPDPGLCETD
jgi:hypothetical protein